MYYPIYNFNKNIFQYDKILKRAAEDRTTKDPSENERVTMCDPEWS